MHRRHDSQAFSAQHEVAGQRATCGCPNQSHRVISRHHLVQFLCDPNEIFLSRHRCIYSTKNEPVKSNGCLSGGKKISGEKSWVSGNKCLDPLSRTLRTACSIQSRGVSCCGDPSWPTRHMTTKYRGRTTGRHVMISMEDRRFKKV